VSFVLDDWPRQFYQPGGGDPFLSYAVFGSQSKALELSGTAYRSRGLPAEMQIIGCDRHNHPEFFRLFTAGPTAALLDARYPELANVIHGEDHCVRVQGRVSDSQTLNYLRDVVGVLTCLLDGGGAAIYDLLTFQAWSPINWREKIFDHGNPVPHQHAIIHVSPEESGTEWVYTRGMRKFGRVDISVHNVTAQYREAVIHLCNRFIEHQAFGAVIPEGQQIRMAGLPPGMVCYHRGDIEDPDFNNVHVEIVWPAL
jgi:hypothetical protein